MNSSSEVGSQEVSSQESKPDVASEEDVMAAIEEDGRAEIASRQAKYRNREERERQLRKKHDESYEHGEILLRRRELSSQDLKALVAFAEHFGLNFDVQENLGKLGWLDRRGLMISISEPAF